MFSKNEIEKEVNKDIKNFKTVEKIDKEITAVCEYTDKLKNCGIYTEYQSNDLKYHEIKLEKLKDKRTSLIQKELL